MEKQYVDLIKQIDQIEAASVKVELNLIDISMIQSTQMQHPNPNFRMLLDLAMTIESGKVQETMQAQHQRQQTPKQMVQMQQIAAKAAAQSQSMVMTAPEPKPEQQQPIERQVQQPPPPKPSLSESVKDEMSSFANKLTKNSEPPHQPINAFKMQIAGDDDLILPKLSTSDQISELERILEGLQQKAFDNEHIAIIKKEALGLNKIIMRDRKQGIYGKESSGIEQSLILIRDQRLNEVIAILGGT